MPPEFGRDVDRLLVLELHRELDADRGRAARRGRRARRRRHARCGSRRPARSPRARSSSSGSTSVRCGSRRSCRSPRRSRAASRRGSTRFARSSPPTCASGCRSPTRSRARRGARPLGALALLGRAVPSGQVREALTCLLGGRRRPVGGGDAGVGPARRRRRATAPSCSTSLREETLRRGARDAVRRALVETLLHGNRVELVEALDETLLGLRARPASLLPRRLIRRSGGVRRIVTKTAQSSCIFAGYRRWMDEARPGAGAARAIERLERGRGCTGALLLDELRALVGEAEAWARTEGDAERAQARAAVSERTSGGRHEGMR